MKEEYAKWRDIYWLLREGNVFDQESSVEKQTCKRVYYFSYVS